MKNLQVKFLNLLRSFTGRIFQEWNELGPWFGKWKRISIFEDDVEDDHLNQYVTEVGPTIGQLF